ncbi:hypothetical protein T11_11776, partial [Trichinella zimbabwensis]
LCYDGPFWDDARLHHGDVTGVIELECRRSTVGGSCWCARDPDFPLLFANLSPERIKRSPQISALIFHFVLAKR